jgi:hypothetical protein
MTRGPSGRKHESNGCGLRVSIGGGRSRGEERERAAGGVRHAPERSYAAPG